MIKESARRNYDVVIVWKLDRFACNRYDSAKYKAILKKNDIKVVSATESISEGAEGIILEAVLEGMAEYYSADLAEKVTRGMTENALKCKYNGGIAALIVGIFVRNGGPIGGTHANYMGTLLKTASCLLRLGRPGRSVNGSIKQSAFTLTHTSISISEAIIQKRCGR